MQSPIEHILVPTNFGTASTNAIAYAAAIARGTGARLHLVHVLKQPFATSGPYEFHLPDTPDRRERRYQLALSELRRVAAAIEGVEVSAEVREGTVIDSTAKAALDYGASLIVLGTYRHSALKHLIDGGSVERLLRVAPCPVLAVGERRKNEPSPRHERKLVA